MIYRTQPPSGGCVLKPLTEAFYSEVKRAAAFGRLCVETSAQAAQSSIEGAAAFGRLCVETMLYQSM